jgi:hypothetical protein
MSGTGSHRIALICAALASGPIYLCANAAAALIDATPDPIVVTAADVVRFFLLLIPGIIGGFFIALIPLGLTILFLSALARRLEQAQAPLFWSVAGAAGGGLLAWMTETGEFGTAFALIVSGAASLRLARAYLAWLPPLQPLPRAPARVTSLRLKDMP